ncbi:glycoside hydrolase family 68 protein [Gluconobacter albidus]|uniref:glycoside hydrolase family 68 protein n=1 Tax=Gluconobacter albidus TaxID=318683 RepID=UPI0038D22E05
MSHHFTYSDNLQKPDSVYGFVFDNGLAGLFKPMNSSGRMLDSNLSYLTEIHNYGEIFAQRAWSATAAG